jgi:hypothetical protein
MLTGVVRGGLVGKVAYMDFVDRFDIPFAAIIVILCRYLALNAPMGKQ